MAAPLEYDFTDRLVMSQGTSANQDVADILVSNIPSAVSAYQAHQTNDRTGTDWWVELRTSKHLSVDCKVRAEDWASKSAQDDLALETWSVLESEVVGWTRDRDKRTDYVLWLWTDTGRWCLVPFPMLCRAFEINWRSWKEQYKTARQFTPRTGGRGYHSECVFVPRREVWAEIYRIYGGAAT